MGSLASGLFGGGGSGGSAAGAQNEFLTRAINEMRRQFDETQENVAPFVQAGTGVLPGLIAGSNVEGLDRQLDDIFNSRIFGSLVDERERAARGQLAAGGLTRSGAGLQEIANVPTGLGLQLSSLINARQAELAGSGQNAAVNLGSIGANTSSNIANLIAEQGRNVGSGIITDQQSDAQGISNLIGAASTAASIFFPSDPALKENVEPIGVVGDLTLTQWDWREETKGTLIEKYGTIGFMADEVDEKYPHHIMEFGGFMGVNYPALLDELQAKYGRA